MLQAMQETDMQPSGGSRVAEAVIAFVIANFAEEIALDDLAEAAGMSRFSFCRRFHQECGMPPMRWLWTFRTVLANELIALDPSWSLTDVAFSCGFTSSAHFSRSFKATYGASPSVHRKLAQQALAVGATTGFDRVFGDNRAAVTKALTLSLASARDGV